MSDIFRSVLCTSIPVTSCLPISLVNVQTGLVVADTSSTQAISFLDNKLLVTLQDTKTAAELLRENDGAGKCLVEHYLAMEKDVFGLKKISRDLDPGGGGQVRIRTVKEINSTNKENQVITASDTIVFATQNLLEVIHDMLIEIASDILSEERELVEDSNHDTLSFSLSSGSFSEDTEDMSCLLGKMGEQEPGLDFLSLSPVSLCSLPTSSSSGFLDSDSEEEKRDKIQLEKLLQDKKSLLSQIMELEMTELEKEISPLKANTKTNSQDKRELLVQSEKEPKEVSPPRAYKRKNCKNKRNLLEPLDLEPVSSEEEEWTSIPLKKRSILTKDKIEPE